MKNTGFEVWVLQYYKGKFDSIGYLSSPSSSNVNVMNIFDNTPRRKRSHGHCQYTSPQLHDVSINVLLPFPFAQNSLEMNNFRTKLYSSPLSKLNYLYTTCLQTLTTDPYSTLYKLTAIILDVG